MKRTLFTLTAIALLVAACGAKRQTTIMPDPALSAADIHPTATREATAVAPATETSLPLNAEVNDRVIFGAGLISSKQTVLDGLPGATMYQIDLWISDDLLQLDGQERIHYTNCESEPLGEIYFRLFPNATGDQSKVSAVKVDDQDVTPVYEFKDTAIRLLLPSTLGPGEQVEIQMSFDVQVAQMMEGNYGLFGYFDGVLALDEFYPIIPVYDEEGWNVEVPPPNADSTYVDASFYVVRVTAPAGLTLVASGVEIARESEDSNQIVTFAAGPARDFYLAASADYMVISERVGETTVNSYALVGREEGASLALRSAVGALESFNQRFGLYPYTEFDVAGTPMQALGIEYPGIVGISLALYDPAQQVSGLPSQVILESTTAHEVAHQWFYNVVGNDQIDEPWLDEAVVQYVTGLYYLDTYGEAAAESYRASWGSRWDRVERAVIPIGLPAGAYQDREYGAIVYGRGPIFISVLVEEMGQEVFDAFLRDYYESHRWGIGTGEVFRQLAEQHCQCDLTALFEAWVYERTP